MCGGGSGVSHDWMDRAKTWKAFRHLVAEALQITFGRRGIFLGWNTNGLKKFMTCVFNKSVVVEFKLVIFFVPNQIAPFGENKSVGAVIDALRGV